MTTTPNKAGSAPDIDLDALTRYDHQGCCMAPDATGDYFLIAEVRDALARATPQHPDHLSNAEFLSKRLARVAKLAGVTMPSGTHEQIAEVAGTILGDIARHLEKAATPQHSVTGQALTETQIIELDCLRITSEGDEYAVATSSVIEFAQLIEREVIARLAALAQPLASTAAAQPEHASSWKGNAIPVERLVESLKTYAKCMPTAARAQWAMSEAAKLIELRAALAIPASMAPTQPEPTLIQALETGDERESPSWFDIKASEVATYSEEGYKVRKLYERADVPASTAASEQHPDDAAVDRFAAVMKAKMAASRAKGRSGWDDEMLCTDQFLADSLMRHTQKGDPVDVANFAMMLHQRGDTLIAGTALKLAALDFAKRVASAWVPERAELMRAAEYLECYAKYLYEVKVEDIEQHPYIPSIEEAASELRAMLAAAPDTATTAADQKTERKTQQLGEGMARTGYILQDDTGRACIVHQGAVRWLSNAELWNVVHPAADQQGDTASASIGDDVLFGLLLGAVEQASSDADDEGADPAVYDKALRELIAHIDERAQQGAAQAQAGETSDAVAVEEWSYSTDEERYHDPEPSRIAIIRHALAEVDGREDCPGGFWIGRNKHFVGRIDASWIIEQLQEQASDECGEYAETYLEDVTKDEEEELESLVNAWAARVDRSAFWMVSDTEFITIEQAREIDRAAMAAPGVISDPCPQCRRGGVCSTIGCGRKRSSELMSLYGMAAPATSNGSDA